MGPIISRERWDLQWLAAVRCKSPVLCQLRLVRCCPFHDEVEGTRGDHRLRKHGYPPDKQEKATRTVLEQAAVLSETWATV